MRKRNLNSCSKVVTSKLRVQLDGLALNAPRMIINEMTATLKMVTTLFTPSDSLIPNNIATDYV